METKKQPRLPKVWEALIPIVFMMVVIMKFRVNTGVGLFAAAVLADGAVRRAVVIAVGEPAGHQLVDNHFFLFHATKVVVFM